MPEFSFLNMSKQFCMILIFNHMSMLIIKTRLLFLKGLCRLWLLSWGNLISASVIARRTHVLLAISPTKFIHFWMLLKSPELLQSHKIGAIFFSLFSKCFDLYKNNICQIILIKLTYKKYLINIKYKISSKYYLIYKLWKNYLYQFL